METNIVPVARSLSLALDCQYNLDDIDVQFSVMKIAMNRFKMI